ncbi:2-oxo acid dehydrogenase subunit E2 [Sciscionella sediminilitoris]|uniref:2-oxo acid dehydrogenase subunit E2 n=1 Tax=Sciscionella sediminilitoris TaxID=1445613 RepID=UPI000689BEE3|nr:2-oxo acid dehydrogenase subunit E2 [Sciscionella sp. SE31]
MAYSVTLPALGESVTDGTVTRWLKQEGDAVALDEPLLEVSTDKVDTEVPSPIAGTLQRIAVREDETIEVGGELAVIEEDTGAEPTTSTGNDRPAKREASAAPEPTEPSGPVRAPEDKRALPYATPRARRLASEHGIDLSTPGFAGAGGRIRQRDVLAAIEAGQRGAPSPVPSEPKDPAPDAPPAARSRASPARAETHHVTEKASRTRQTIARRTRESLQASAQLTQVFEVDFTRIARLREQAGASFHAREGVELTFLPFLAKATIEALGRHPELNACFHEETKEITYFDQVDLAVAVDTGKGQLSPVVPDAGQLNLAGLSRAIADLASRTRAQRVTADELSGGTFTVTDLGSNGALFDTPIINQPQSGILGLGSIVKRPVTTEGPEGQETIAIRSMAYLALTYDHRIIDGADAGRFLTTIKRRLQEGQFHEELGL